MPPCFRYFALPCLLALLAIFSPAQPVAQAQASSAHEQMLRTLFSGTAFSQVTLSPDGQQVAWVEQGSDGSTLFVSRAVAGATPKRVAVGGGHAPHGEESPAWSADSQHLAFLSTTQGEGQTQLYSIDVRNGEPSGKPRQLTHLKGFVSSPAWSPDGKRLAFLFIENADRAAGPLVAETVHTGVIKDAFTEQRLAIISASGGNVEQISPADMYVYEFDWSPDGQHLVTSAAFGNGDNNWYVAQLYIIAASGGPMKSLYQPALQIANPIWSPDGASIAFIEGLMSDEGSTGGDVFVVPAAGGASRNLTPGMKASASWLTWRGSNAVLFGEDVDGDTGLATVDLSGAISQLWRGGEAISASVGLPSAALSADGKVSALVRRSFSQPPELWLGAIGAWKQHTSVNRELKPAWGEARSIHWQNESYNLQGWLLYPANFDPAKRYPMVVSVHGGPGGAYRSSWPGSHSFPVALSGAGYFVFFPNPRGGFGQGEAFTRANVRDFGYGDFRDVMTGVDAVLKQAPVDEHRLGITGWSYGGYMTMWAVTHTDRFAAAAAGAGLANLQSYVGENQIDGWLLPFFGATVYDDPAVYARSSPLTYIKNAKTPTLILVGDSDGECPTPQSYEFWHALKTLKVPTELVVYEHEGHSFAKPEHQRDVIERVTAWFDQRLK